MDKILPRNSYGHYQYMFSTIETATVHMDNIEIKSIIFSATGDGKTQTAKFDLQYTLYKYKVEEKNRSDALNLIGKEPKELWQEIHR